METTTNRTTSTFLALVFALMAVAAMALLGVDTVMESAAGGPVSDRWLWTLWGLLFVGALAAAYVIARVLQAVEWIVVGAAAVAFPPVVVAAYWLWFVAACSGWTSDRCPFS